MGYSLADSPIGLLAWIYEKLVNWTDDYAWDDDEGRVKIDAISLLTTTVLTWISLYWFSRAGPAASLRIYYEATRTGERSVPPSRTPKIPLGASYFAKELRHAPRKYVK